MAQSKASAALSGGWLDLGTKTGIDFRLYEPLEDGGEIDAVHSKDLHPITYYSRVAVPLKKSGQVSQASYQFAKSADYAGNSWYTFTTPDIRINDDQVDNYQIAYSPNFGHHVAKLVTLYINEIPILKYDAVTMDMLSEANLSAGQYEGYMRSIGNTRKALTFSRHLPPIEVTKILHELFFVQKNRPSPQDAYPLCASKNNTLSIGIDFVETLEDVIRIRKNTAVAGQPKVWVDWNPRGVNLSSIVTVSGSQGLAMPMPEVWCEYAVILGEERKTVQATPFELMIKQFQSFTGPRVSVGSDRRSFNFSGPTRALYFAARNATASDKRYFSNYSTAPEDENIGLDPIRTATLWYDSNPRIQNAPGTHFSSTEFLLHAARAPAKKGIHLLAYCEDTTSSEIDATSNFSKLSTDLEVNIVEASTDSDDAATTPSQYQLEVRSESVTLIRFEDGIVAFPNYDKAGQ